MREPFAYENNALLIRRNLVPDPLSPEVWNAAVARWEGKREQYSLMEWLVVSEVIGETELLACMGEALGVGVCGSATCRVRASGLAEGNLLRAQGFLELESPGSRHRVAGGPAAAPDLSQLIGPAAAGWEWILLSPLRGRGSGPGHVEESRDAGNGYGLENQLQEMLFGLWAEGAADIHFERVGEQMQIRIHRAGRMRLAAQWEGGRMEASLRMIKTWAGLSTASDPMPGDGRIHLAMGERELDFRVSHLRTVNGESLVLRVPGNGTEIRSLAELGVPGELQRALVDTVENDPGMIVFTGTTCSGKTTSAYGLLHELAGHNLKILSIEDPVEYEIPAAVQSAVDERNGWSFERAIRAYLRQDPEVIFIGEIRDRESAGAGCRAALTGHCVLSTLHGGTETAALERLAGWGLDAGTLSESLRLIVNQRLVSGEQGLVAEFSWMRPNPEQIYDLLRPSRRSAATS